MLKLLGRFVGAVFGLSLVLTLSACGDTGGLSGTPQPAGPTRASANAASVCAPPVKSLQVNPHSLTLTLAGSPGQFTACTQYFSTYTLSVAPLGVVSVPSSVTPIVDPLTGVKSALVTVTPLAAGRATIVVADKKGNTGSVTVVVASAAGAQRLFADNGSNAILIFSPPFTPTSTGLPLPVGLDPFFIALDSTGTLAVRHNGMISVYKGPVTFKSAAYATFDSGPGVGGPLAFDFSGKLYAGTLSSGISVFTPPFTNSSTPSSVATNGTSQAEGVAFDSAGNLYVSDVSTIAKVLVYAPPYTGAPATSVTIGSGAEPVDIAVNGTSLFASDVGQSRILVYALPISSTSTPAFDITIGISICEGIALDANGNLYVMNAGVPNVSIFTPPFSAASAPAVTLSTGFSGTPFGVAVGK